MAFDPKEQNAELQKLIGANKQRLEHTQKVIRDLQKRAGHELPKAPARRPGSEKSS